MKTNRAFMQAVRREAAMQAYTTALDWVRRHPAAELEERLIEKLTQLRGDAPKSAKAGLTGASSHTSPGQSER